MNAYGGGKLDAEAHFGSAPQAIGLPGQVFAMAVEESPDRLLVGQDGAIARGKDADVAVNIGQQPGVLERPAGCRQGYGRGRRQGPLPHPVDVQERRPARRIAVRRFRPEFRKVIQIAAAGDA